MNKNHYNPNYFHTFWICAALVFATIAVYYQVWTYDFVNYDDNVYVYQNPDIQAGITFKAIKWAFTTTHTSIWHPLTWLSHMLGWQLFGHNAGGHHLINLVFHIANTLLLFVVLKQMTGSLWPSAFVAALFALHPLHVESVAWVTERKDVLSTFFWILTMAAYLRYVKHPGTARYLLTLLTFALGIMAKSMLVTLPFVLLLLDYWPLARIPSGQAVVKTGKQNEKHMDIHFHKLILYHLIWEKTPFFALSAVSSVVTFFAQRSGGIVVPITLVPLKFRISNALVSYMEYIRKMIWPSRLAVFYPHPVQGVSFSHAAMSAGVLIVVTILILRFSKNRRYLVTGWFWFLGTLVPVIGLVQVGDQAMADRYSYITLTGLFIIIAWGLPELLGKWPHRKIALWASALIVLFALATQAHLQQRYWKDSITLFQHALEVTNDNYIAYANIADTFMKQGKFAEAISPFNKALQIAPNFVNFRINLGYALTNSGKLEEAVKEYEKILLTQPQNAIARNNLGAVLYRQEKFDQAAEEYRKSLQTEPDDPNVLNALGLALGRQGKLDEAIKYFTEALRIKPDFADAHTDLGYALVLQGNHNDAAVHFTEALQLDPNHAEAHYYLGQVLAQRGKINEAIVHFEEALRLKPDWVEPMNDLAWLLATSKKTTVHNPDRALKLAQHACELTKYKKPGLLDTLAATYAATGAFGKAVETAEKALELCQSSEQETLKKEIKSRLVLYKAGKPYIETR